MTMLAWNTTTLYLLAALGAAFEPSAPLQDGTPPSVPPLEQAPGARPPVDPFAHLLPGALPEATTPEAEELWLALCDATLAPGAVRKPIVAFDLSFEVLTRKGAQTNNGDLRHRYLAPAYVRTMLESGNEQGRGPGGYWGRFPGGDDDEIVRYEGRTYEEDRWAIDQSLEISRNFVSIADPGSLRIIELTRLPAAPLEEVAPALRSRARELRWLEIVSPDFGMPTRRQLPAGVQQVYRVRIGSDPRTDAPVLVSIQPRDAVRRARDLPAQQPYEFEGFLIELRTPVEVDGFLLPREIHHHPYRVVKAAGATELRTEFPRKPEQEFYLIEGALAPELTADSFKP